MLSYKFIKKSINLQASIYFHRLCTSKFSPSQNGEFHYSVIVSLIFKISLSLCISIFFFISLIFHSRVWAWLFAKKATGHLSVYNIYTYISINNINIGYCYKRIHFIRHNII